ncbi:MAG: DNA polymerase III subunit chi, partial [Gammaproteobacteria bacterium]
MTRVDFYVVEGSSALHDRTLCRVVEKAWQRGHAVYVNCDDGDAARHFDELLWQFQDTSFVPHALAREAGDDTPVIIGTAIDEAPAHDVLVNLAAAVPAA